jgi:hypothetical protein
MAAGTDPRVYVQQEFATLVQALAESRTEGLFSSEVFLSVLSTDPSPYLEGLEKSSVECLNQVELVEARALS